jgi:DNA processing protein
MTPDAAPIQEDALLFWLALRTIPGLGTRTVHNVVKHFGSPQAAYMASLTELESCGLSAPAAQQIFAQAGLAEAEQEIEAAAKAGATLVHFADARYPHRLREIADPPLVLSIKGDLSVLEAPGIAVVGTRRPSAYGSSVAHRLAADLAQRGIAVISGMARGVDSAAHRGALEAHGKTVAVFGSGIDVLYPAENKRLAQRIMDSGALVSEFPPGTSPSPENFPIRNRIISGLALGVVVVEAAEYSGSLITARLALEQNREVFAVPGNITSPQSFGPNMLIKQGAKLVDDWLDVVEELPPALRQQIGATAGSEAEAAPTLFEQALEGDQKAVFEALQADQPLFVDSICDNVGLTQPRVLTALLGLEMNGLVRQLPGMNFIRKL